MTKDTIDHPVIYLQPWCDECERCQERYEGRMWCQDDAWGECPDCDRKAVKYVLAKVAP
jgi:predicted nucleic acid-binding Zn ribbon protein